MPDTEPQKPPEADPMSAGGRAQTANTQLSGEPPASDPSECRFCHWWNLDLPFPREELLLHRMACVRRSPTASEGSMGPRTNWPVTLGNERCGDFERFRNVDGSPNTETHLG